MLLCPKCRKIFFRAYNYSKHLSRCLFSHNNISHINHLSGGRITRNFDISPYWELKRINKKYSKKWGSKTILYNYKYRHSKHNLHESVEAIEEFFKSLMTEIKNFTNSNDLIQIILESDNNALDFSVNTKYTKVSELSNISLAEHFSRILQSNATFKFDDNLSVTVQKISNTLQTA